MTEREALKSLANEVTGLLGMPGLREAIGNTNVAVLRDRLENAQAALAATPAVATSASPCLNCCCPSDELFCGMCREMGCSIPSATPAAGGEEGARLSNWLADYSHDLMEDGDLDQEAVEVAKASKWIADRLAAQPVSPLRGSQDVPYPVYKAVERILDENSAWIARPSDEVTKRIALAATVAAHSIIAASPPEQPAADPVMEREEIARAFLYETGMFDNKAEIKANPEHRLVKAAYAAADRLLTAPDKQPLRYGEPVWPGNENDDLDKGDDA